MDAEKEQAPLSLRTINNSPLQLGSHHRSTPLQLTAPSTHRPAYSATYSPVGSKAAQPTGLSSWHTMPRQSTKQHLISHSALCWQLFSLPSTAQEHSPQALHSPGITTPQLTGLTSSFVTFPLGSLLCYGPLGLLDTATVLVVEVATQEPPDLLLGVIIVPS